MEIIKSYKGFNKDMTCDPTGSNPFQYEEGKEYKEEGASACNYGFHACERPLDIFNYYKPAESVYHEVEQSGDISRNNSGKIASSKIKIGARLDIVGLVKAQIEYVKNHTTMEYTDPERATAGNYGAATAGDYGVATSRGSAASGENGLSVARGNNVRVKGGIGAILVIVEEERDGYNIREWKAAVVDGKEIKADTWYKLENGELIEVEE